VTRNRRENAVIATSIFIMTTNKHCKTFLSLDLDTGLGVGDLHSKGFGLREDVDALARRDGRGDPD
jgi:hypothetical protein